MIAQNQYDPEAALRDFLSTHSHNVSQKRLGILLPALPDTAAIVREFHPNGMIQPVLIGTEEECALFQHMAGLANIDVISCESSIEGAAIAVETKRVDILLRGETGVHALLQRLLTVPEFRYGWISQVALLYPPKLNRPLLLSDGAVTLQPTLDQKIKIVENALKVARTLRFDPPKVALLAAVETISADQTVGMHDAILAKMSERGQFGNALLDGPLALDLALSEEAAIKKKVKGAVAGKADILIAPTLEVGNALYKALITLAHSASASVVVGGSVPIALPSRSDHPSALLFSIQLSCIVS
ncbi:MAG: phosphate acyltransferase [bacterium]|nr:phosphate acyltransferase [bacterium]